MVVGSNDYKNDRNQKDSNLKDFSSIFLEKKNAAIRKEMLGTVMRPLYTKNKNPSIDADEQLASLIQDAAKLKGDALKETIAVLGEGPGLYSLVSGMAEVGTQETNEQIIRHIADQLVTYAFPSTANNYDLEAFLDTAVSCWGNRSLAVFIDQASKWEKEKGTWASPENLVNIIADKAYVCAGFDAALGESTHSDKFVNLLGFISEMCEIPNLSESLVKAMAISLSEHIKKAGLGDEAEKELHQTIGLLIDRIIECTPFSKQAKVIALLESRVEFDEEDFKQVIHSAMKYNDNDIPILVFLQEYAKVERSQNSSYELASAIIELGYGKEEEKTQHNSGHLGPSEV